MYHTLHKSELQVETFLTTTCRVPTYCTYICIQVRIYVRMYIHNTDGTPQQSQHTQRELTQVTPCKLRTHSLKYARIHTDRTHAQTYRQTHICTYAWAVSWLTDTRGPAPLPSDHGAAGVVPTRISPHASCVVSFRSPAGAGLAVVKFAIIHILYTHVHICPIKHLSLNVYIYIINKYYKCCISMCLLAFQW